MAPMAEDTLKVTKTADTNDGTCDSDCSLREAVVAANADPDRDTIRVPAGTYKLTSPEGDLDIESEVAIEAVRGTAVIDGQSADRVLEITASGEAYLTGLEIANGRLQAGQGGGILNAGLAYITHSTITSNSAPTGGGLANSGGTLALRFSTVSDNSADFGGGINNEGGRVEVETSLLWKNFASFSGGGLYNVAGEAHFRNSTVSANRSNSSGAGIYQISDEVVSIVSSTIIGNSADLDNDNGDGGGVFVGGGVNPGGVLITNSLLFGNADGGPIQHPNCSGPLDSLGHNIILVNTGCDITLEPTDLNSAATTGALARNGGPTMTYALPADSVAIGHGPTGTVACSGTDQRGVPRTGSCDTGAYQLETCDTAVINVVGTDGRDRLQGSQGADGILAKGGADRVEAGAGADRVCGGAGNDKLFGGTGRDVLVGHAGNDLLDGGPGKDRCRGGAGRDRQVSC